MRIQYKDVPGDLFNGTAARNELVIRVQPNEGVHLKVSIELFLNLLPSYLPTDDDQVSRPGI